jgi:hypothetical protein
MACVCVSIVAEAVSWQGFRRMLPAALKELTQAANEEDADGFARGRRRQSPMAWGKRPTRREWRMCVSSGSLHPRSEPMSMKKRYASMALRSTRRARQVALSIGQLSLVPTSRGIEA